MNKSLITQHVKNLENIGKSENTIISYRSRIKNFLLDVEKSFDDINQSDVDEYIEYLRCSVSISSFNVSLVALKSFFDSAGSGLRINAKQMAVDKFYKPIPSREQVIEVMDVAEASDPGFLGARNKAIIAVFYYTGVRIEEACNVNLFDINFRSQTLHIPKSKNGTSREVPISNNLMDVLLHYLKFRSSIKCKTNDLFISYGLNHRGSGIVYGSFRHIVRRCFNRDGLDGLNPYCLRHLFATALVKSGAALPDIARLMGHKSVKSIFDYYVPDDVSPSQIVEAL